MTSVENKKDKGIALGLFIATWLIGSSLLWFGGRTLSSPDETAVLVATEHIAQDYRARLAEPLASKAGWMHPRSWVSQGEGIVPVGFIGWPWVLSVFMFIFSAAITKWLTVGIAASAVPALYLLLRKEYSKTASLAGTLVMATFPAYLLYLNRSLFPNPPILALVLWLTWLLSSDTKLNTKSIRLFAGVLLAGIMIIRPIELFWILPWLSAVIFSRVELWSEMRREWRSWLMWVTLGASIVFLPVWLLAWRTYGAPWRVGYFLRDNSVSAMQAVSTATMTKSSVTFFAFGFHPRNIWWNIRVFALGYAWPWTVLLVTMAGIYLRPWIAVCWKYRHKLKKVLRELTPPDYRLIGAIVSLGLLVMYYGNGLYQDHIRLGSVTVGNSFLRYLLPVAALGGWAIAWAYDRIEKKKQPVIILLAIILATLGAYKAGFGDDESLYAVIKSTRLNDQTRQKTEQVMPAGSVIFSDRSDKIFFPAYKAVSPMPPITQIADFLRGQSVMSALYTRPLSQKQRDEWRAQGLQLEELFAFDRFVLYRIQYLP